MIKFIITHNGKFHLDEVFAYSLLTFLYSNIHLIRTRNLTFLETEVKNTESILIDVGWSYTPEFNNFDHHMIDDNLVTTKKTSSLNISLIRQEIRKNIKNYLTKNGIYLSKIDSNKFIQKFRSLEKNEKQNINIEQYKINFLQKDIVKYLTYIKNTYNIIDPLNKIDNLISFPTFYYKEFYNLFDFRKYSSLGLIWKHYGKDILKVILSEDMSKESDIKEDFNSFIDKLWKVIDSDIIRKIDNFDNGIGRDSGGFLENIIENFNSLDSDNHREQFTSFIEASKFLKEYFIRYVKKKIQELKDLHLIKIEYKFGEEIQYFSKYFRGVDSYILSIPKDKTKFIVFKKSNKKYILKTLQTSDFQSRELLPADWLNNKPEGCTFIHPALFISEFNSLDSIKKIYS